MVVFACIALNRNKRKFTPTMADFSGVPTLFGVSIYSFMCHHSLPSLITPIGNKSKLTSMFACDYLLILVFYCIIAFTGAFSTDHLHDLYTLNFQPPTCRNSSLVDAPLTQIPFFQYILALFPVIVLSTNFPIIGITLRNNLKTLFVHGRSSSFFVDKLLFPFATLIIPFAIVMGTNKVDVLVGVTGSYAGAVIQYIVPVTMVYICRRKLKLVFGDSVSQSHKSPFSHNAWLIFVLVWAIACICLVTINHIITRR